MGDWAQTPVRALAYVGDAVYELHVRERTLREGGNVNALHKATVAHVSAVGQAAIAKRLVPHLTETELAVFKRARNNKGGGPRKVPPDVYQLGTAFEALVGYLYLKPDRERLDGLLAIVDTFHKEDSHAP
ncbi:MAG: ribonuclease [Cyanobacteria bacterium RYN_339]|nr:ribonuclease [Cyanobacteria bacterium RYN_339]